MEISDLKSRIFALLREDEEFRYAVEGVELIIGKTAD
jgi:hypothetical protein